MNKSYIIDVPATSQKRHVFRNVGFHYQYCGASSAQALVCGRGKGVMHSSYFILTSHGHIYQGGFRAAMSPASVAQSVEGRSSGCTCAGERFPPGPVQL